MDRITHQVRLANWTKIIEQCNNRPAGTTAKQWLSDNGISDKSYYYWLRKLRQEAYANAEKEFPAVRPSQEQQPCRNLRRDSTAKSAECHDGYL